MQAVLAHLLLMPTRHQQHIFRNALPSINSFGLVQGYLAAESGCIMGCLNSGFSAFSMQCTHADLALQDEDMEEYDDDEEAEEVDEDDMGVDDEEEDEDEEDEEEEQDGLPFINPYHVNGEEEDDGEEQDDGEEEDEEEEEDNEEEEGADGLLEVDADAFGVEVNRRAGWEQSERVLGSGSPATRARRMELAGKPAFFCC